MRHVLPVFAVVAWAWACEAAPTAHPPLFLMNSGTESDLDWVARQGFTHQLSANVAPMASYAWFDDVAFPPGSPQDAWRLKQVAAANASINAVAASGLRVASGMDIFVVPKALFDKYEANFTAGDAPSPAAPPPRIALNSFTLHIAAGMLREVLALFPAVSTVIVRVGENYGGPVGPVQWVGNGAVDFSQPFPVQQAAYVTFIAALREVVCVSLNRTLVFRTWDTSGFGPHNPARFHPSRPYYLNVTNAVAPHPRLVFSVKHVALDFWRYVAWNPTLNTGQHPQIVEVEAAREYEGKGALPCYVGDGVINGFSEMGDEAVGLQAALSAPNSTIVGLWVWSSGGGWAGPTLHGASLWPRLTAGVLAGFYRSHVSGTPVPEPAAFQSYCTTQLAAGDTASCAALHDIALQSQDGVLALRYSRPYDGARLHACGGSTCSPTNNWLRDDRLCGLQCLGDGSGPEGNPGAFPTLFAANTLSAAVAEKGTAVTLFNSMHAAAVANVTATTGGLAQQAAATTAYGAGLAGIVASGWRVLALGYSGNRTGAYNVSALHAAIAEYDGAWAAYNHTLAAYNGFAASPFHPYYEGGHLNSRITPGLGASVDRFRNVTPV